MDMRQWLRDQGFTVGTRGRFSPEMIAAWDKAHPDSTYASGTATKTASTREARKAEAQDKRERKVRRQRVVLGGAESDPNATDQVPEGDSLTSGVKAPEIAYQEPVRDEKSRMIKVDGYSVAWDTCGQCTKHLNYCACEGGPVVPKYLREMAGV